MTSIDFLDVRYLDVEHAIQPGDVLSFGRDPGCDLIVDPDDTGVSRLHGRLYWSGDRWWVANHSKKRALHVIEGGFGYPIFPARGSAPSSRPLMAAKATVLVPGVWHTYPIQLGASPRPGGPVETRNLSDSRTTEFDVILSNAQHAALVAMAWGWLQPAGAYEPVPASNHSIATRLGISVRTVEKHVAELRDRTARLTVLPSDPREARLPICEYYLANQLVTHHHIDWLNQYLTNRRTD